MKFLILGILIVIVQFGFAATPPSTCTACHGAQGISPNDNWPNLRAQKSEYLSEQLKMFRSGARVNALMSPIAKMLTDEDIKNLSDYFSKMKAP